MCLGTATTFRPDKMVVPLIIEQETYYKSYFSENNAENIENGLSTSLCAKSLVSLTATCHRKVSRGSFCHHCMHQEKLYLLEFWLSQGVKRHRNMARGKCWQLRKKLSPRHRVFTFNRYMKCKSFSVTSEQNPCKMHVIDFFDCIWISAWLTFLHTFGTEKSLLRAPHCIWTSEGLLSLAPAPKLASS